MKITPLFVLMLISISVDGQSNIADSLNILLADKSLNESTRIDRLNGLAYRCRASDPASSIAGAREAFEAARKIDYKKGEGTASVIMGEYYWARAEYEKSLEWGLSALRISEVSGEKKGLMNSYFLLGITYNALNDTVKCDAYLDRTLALSQELKDNEMSARVYNTFGLNKYRRHQNPTLGLPFYLKALSFVQTDDNSIQKVFILGNVGSAYGYIGDGDKSLALLQEALRIAKYQNNRIGEANIHSLLGDSYKERNEFSLAEEHYTICEQLARQLGARRILQNVYIPHLDLKLKAGKETHDYQMQYAKARDSIFNAERAQQVAEMEIRYETEKKEQTIKLLEQKMDIQNSWRNVLIGGVVFTLLVSLLLYLLQRARTQKTKEFLEVQQVLNDKLKGLDQIKSRFFANLSHAFRTPLTLILAPLEEEIKRGKLDDEKERLLLMKRNASRLLELVNQLLDLSKLEDGKVELRVKPGDAEPFLRVIVASFDSLAEHREITFIKKIALNGQLLWFDQDKLEKIVANLLANAFKFTPANGTVNFTATFQETVTGKVLTIVISDTGMGIPKDEQEEVFLPFYQVKQSLEGYQKGTGLGLSLVKELVKLYGGTIRLRSAVGTGTTFFIEMPADRKAFAQDQINETLADARLMNNIPALIGDDLDLDKDRDESDDESLPLRNDSVLVVEDNTDLRNFISSVLGREFTVMTANNGEEALKLALRIVPSLVLSDLMMPRMDGIELTEKMKMDERTSHIPIILLTAKDEPQSRLAGLKTGADDYLTKPFSTEELLARIGNLIRQRKQLAERFREKILVLASPSNESSMEEKFLHKVRSVVEIYLSDFTFTVEKLAEETGLSRTQLLRKLKALTGLSPNEFIKDMRLKRAADMIRQKADTVTQIGYAVGFNDQSYFTKCFKKQFGIPPSEFLPQAKQDNNIYR